MKNSASKLLLGPMLERAIAADRTRNVGDLQRGIMFWAMVAFCTAVGAAIGKGSLDTSVAAWVGALIGATASFLLLHFGAFPFVDVRRYLEDCNQVVGEIAIVNDQVAFKNLRSADWSRVPIEKHDAEHLAKVAGIKISEERIGEGLIRVPIKCTTSGQSPRVAYISAILEYSKDLDPLEIFIEQGKDNTSEAVSWIEKLVANNSSSCPEPDAPGSELSAYQQELETIMEAQGANGIIATPATPFVIRRIFVNKVADE